MLRTWSWPKRNCANKCKRYYSITAFCFVVGFVVFFNNIYICYIPVSCCSSCSFWPSTAICVESTADNCQATWLLGLTPQKTGCLTELFSLTCLFGTGDKYPQMILLSLNVWDQYTAANFAFPEDCKAQRSKT